MVIFAHKGAKCDLGPGMPTIAVLAMPGCMASSVHNVLDACYVANRCIAASKSPQKADDQSAELSSGLSASGQTGNGLAGNGQAASWQHGPIKNVETGFVARAGFDAKIVTMDGKPVDTTTGQQIHPHAGINDIERPDIILISSLLSASATFADVDSYLKNAAPAVDWVRQMSRDGSFVASACSGTFLLAEAGLLDGRDATTHWMLEGVFRRRYPRVSYHGERLLLEYGDLICGGAFSAFNDVLLRLIERYAGREIAMLCARVMLLEPSRELQQPFAQSGNKHHEDESIARAEAWLKHHFDKKISVEEAADAVAMGGRNFKRRFKAATGETPLEYLQRLRIESAKRQLEQSARSSLNVIWSVGYEDASSFRRLFKKHTGVTMEQYRRRFGMVHAPGAQSPQASAGDLA